jgi:uncharacterized RDD family membrane protein YckC
VVQLIATILEKAPRAPRELRREIPNDLSRLILRCLSKQASERFESYEELHRALYPYAFPTQSPATLALRFVAGAIDIGLLTMVLPFLAPSLLSFAFPGIISPLADPDSGLLFYASGLLLSVTYFTVAEGCWGTTLGKMWVGLRVCDCAWNSPGISRAAMRSLIYLVPHVACLIVFRNGPADHSMRAKAIVDWLYPIFLAVTVRRRNGFATITDLLTKTRVIQRRAYQPLDALESAFDSIIYDESLPTIGPYHTVSTLSSAGNEELILGYDAKLRRRVWIRKLSPGVASLSAVSRDAVRPGRLRWLQGKRTHLESWDAYEAASGTALTALLSQPQAWHNVRRWLLDVASELSAVSCDGSIPAEVSLDRIWITDDGGAKLLDFRAPGSFSVSPIQPSLLLNQVAISALEGRIASEDEARTRSPRMPIGIRAREVLDELRHVSFDTVVDQLREVGRQVPSINWLRRLCLVIGCAAPAVLLSFTTMVLSWAVMQNQRIDLRDALFIHSLLKHSKAEDGYDATARIEAAEILIAHQFGGDIRDQEAWNSPSTLSLFSPERRAEAERISSAYPNPNLADVKRARGILKPLVDSDGHFRRGLIKRVGLETDVIGWGWSLFSQVTLFTAALSILAAVLFRGGLLMRALGIAVVKRDGSNASRLRMLWRACVAWSGTCLAVALGDGVVRGSLSNAWLWTVVLLFGVTLWSAANRGRSLQDRLAGTWLVPA